MINGVLLYLEAAFAFCFLTVGRCTGLCLLCAHMNDFILYRVRVILTEGGICDGGWMYLISFVCVVDTV